MFGAQWKGEGRRKNKSRFSPGKLLIHYSVYLSPCLPFSNCCQSWLIMGLLLISSSSRSSPSFFITTFRIIVTLTCFCAVQFNYASCDRSPRTLLVNVLSKKHLESKFLEDNEHRTLIAVPERTISIEFSPPRSRRFPVLKALVRQIVNPERRDLSIDASSQVNNNADRNSSPSKFRIKRPETEYNKENQKLPIDLVAHEAMEESEDNHLDEKQPGNRRFFLVNVLSRMLRSVNFTAVRNALYRHFRQY